MSIKRVTSIKYFKAFFFKTFSLKNISWTGIAYRYSLTSSLTATPSSTTATICLIHLDLILSFMVLAPIWPPLEYYSVVRLLRQAGYWIGIAFDFPFIWNEYLNRNDIVKSFSYVTMKSNRKWYPNLLVPLVRLGSYAVCTPQIICSYKYVMAILKKRIPPIRVVSCLMLRVILSYWNC